MTILEFTKLFKGYTFHLVFSHLNEDGSTEYDPEYSYRGRAEEFEERMRGYDWLFDFELNDSEVTTIKVHKRARICAIEIEKI